MSRIASTALSATGALAAVGAATAAAAVLETRAFVLHEVTVPVLDPGTLDDGRDAFTILHISDLHMLAGQRLKQNWVAGLDALEPDLVVNTGDNLGEEQAVPAVLRALGPLLRRPG
ncbi:MAG: metallophosphoesterase, partial [Corynebacterium glyciniphilum]|nr:metallophosphoesterase [Corynebacterium glyciniphilum]